MLPIFCFRVYFYAIITPMTDKWIKDTGLVLALILLVLGYSKDSKEFLVASGILLLAAILAPQVMYPIAFLWFKLTELFGLIVPKIFFGIVFFVIVFPMGLIRRLMKGEDFFISGWRESRSVFVERGHLFTKKDLETPY
ncbi:MAG: Membrane protein [Parcubacteria group bacterium GW2011_GWA1_47_8]|nr:MAG: Membrane protein [Parcubacteria group bacterium GW2011_GWA1_47_8]